MGQLGGGGACRASGLSAFAGFILSVVEFLSLHGDVLAEIFIPVHADSEELVVARSASNSRNSELLASTELDESGSRGPGLSPSGLVEVRRGVVELDSRSSSEKSHKDLRLHF